MSLLYSSVISFFSSTISLILFKYNSFLVCS